MHSGNKRRWFIDIFIDALHNSALNTHRNNDKCKEVGRDEDGSKPRAFVASPSLSYSNKRESKVVNEGGTMSSEKDEALTDKENLTLNELLKKLIAEHDGITSEEVTKEYLRTKAVKPAPSPDELEKKIRAKLKGLNK